MTTLRTFAELAARLRAAHSDNGVRIVGIDGCGGAGKTTFASRLARHGEWPVIHTDDFASHDEPIEWWPRMLRQVIEPLAHNEPATFRPYDWVHRELAEPITIEPADVVVIEGVGATRSVWRDRLVLKVWIDAPRDVRLARGIERDGEELREFWNAWMLAEDRYVATDDPRTAADLVVAGDPPAPHADDVFALVSERRPGAGSWVARR